MGVQIQSAWSCFNWVGILLSLLRLMAFYVNFHFCVPLYISTNFLTSIPFHWVGGVWCLDNISYWYVSLLVANWIRKCSFLQCKLMNVSLFIEIYRIVLAVLLEALIYSLAHIYILLRGIIWLHLMYFSANCAYLYIEISVVLVVDILLVGSNDGTKNVLLEGLLCLCRAPL